MKNLLLLKSEILFSYVFSNTEGNSSTDSSKAGLLRIVSVHGVAIRKKIFARALFL